MKHRRVATQNLHEMQLSYACMRSVKKWRGRTESTKFARGCFAKFATLKGNLYKRAIFRVLKLKYQRAKGLALKLSNMAAKFDN